MHERQERDEDKRRSAYTRPAIQAPHWSTKRPGVYGASDPVRVADTSAALKTSSHQLSALDRSVMAFRQTALTRAGSDRQATPSTAPAPGVYGASVFMQMKAAGPAPSAHVHAEAAAGVRGSASALPFHDRIQQAFGRHDISGIRAHTGSEARTSAQRIGARAFAMGDDVVLTDTSDLHTAAHEAAHVVQQRGGVSLKGGVGQVGDRYEQHADAVADAVVAGKSAEGLLDQMAGGSVSAVQRKAVQRSAGGPEVDAPAGDQASAEQAAPRSGVQQPSYEELQYLADKVYKRVLQRISEMFERRVTAEAPAAAPSEGDAVQRKSVETLPDPVGVVQLSAAGHLPDPVAQAPNGAGPAELPPYEEIQSVADRVYTIVSDRLAETMERYRAEAGGAVDLPANAVASAGDAVFPASSGSGGGRSRSWLTQDAVEAITELVLDRIVEEVERDRERFGR